MLKDFDGGSERAVEKELTSPVEQVALAGIHVRGDFVFICGRHEFAVFLFHFSQQVVQFRSVFSLQEMLEQLPGVGEPAGLNVSQGQVVAVIVGSRIDLLSLFEERSGLGDFPSANVGFTQVVVGIKAPRLKLDGFLELLGGEIELSQAGQIGGEVRSGRRRVRLEEDRLL